MKKNSPSNRREQGFTIIEIMIAMLLGLVLVGGVINLFANNNLTYQFVQGNARLQESARFVLSELVGELRMVGYLGCYRSDFDNGAGISSTLNSTTNDYYYDLAAGELELYDLAAGDVLPTALDNYIGADVAADSQVVVIRGVDRDSATLAAAMSDTSANLSVSGASFTAEDVVLISDCQKATIFQLTQVNDNGDGTVDMNHNTGGSSTPGNSTKVLSNATPYANDATVQKFYTKVYFLRDASFTNKQGNAPLSLYVQEGTGTPYELVTGIESMEILAGEDTDSDGVPNLYVGPADISDMSHVVSLDLKITATSIDEIDGEVLSKNFFSSVKIRNR